MPRQRKEKPWQRGEIALLGKLPDAVLARRTGRTIKGVVEERKRRRIKLVLPWREWTPVELKLLRARKFNDHELGRWLRRTHSDVWKKRRELKIEPVVRRAECKSWSLKQIRQLGPASDRQVGRLQGRAIRDAGACATDLWKRFKCNT
jgi:hypothetical protein